MCAAAELTSLRARARQGWSCVVYLYFLFASVLFNSTPIAVRVAVLMYRFRWAKKVSAVALNGALDGNQLTLLAGLKKRTEARYVLTFVSLCLMVCATVSVLVVTFLPPTKPTWSECSACGETTLAFALLLLFCFMMCLAFTVPVIKMRSDASDTCQCARTVPRLSVPSF